jgi:hypothetical protein
MEEEMSLTTPPPLPDSARPDEALTTPPPLDFGRADFAEAPAQATCTTCQKGITRHYYEVNGAVVCGACRGDLARIGDAGTPASRFLRALFAGGAAGLAGSLVYFGIMKLTGYEFGLIAVLVGLGVGAGVKWGCYGRGGALYQALAVALTYFAIVGTYVPLIFEEMNNRQATQEAAAQPATDDAPAAQATPVSETTDAENAEASEPLTFGGFMFGVIALLVFAAALPFLAGLENLIGLVIIGFGLWEAWKINKRPVVVITGPHALSAPAPTAAAV